MFKRCFHTIKQFMHISLWTLMHWDFPAVKLLFRSMSFEGDCQSVKVFRVEFVTSKHPIWEHLLKFLEKVNLPTFLITIACNSLTLEFFQYNTSYQAHSYLFPSMIFMYHHHEVGSIFPLSQFQRILILLFLQYKTLCKIQKKNKWIPFIFFGCLLGKWMAFSWLLPSQI